MLTGIFTMTPEAGGHPPVLLCLVTGIVAAAGWLIGKLGSSAWMWPTYAAEKSRQAVRAAESTLPDAYVVDPLASAFCDADALERKKQVLLQATSTAAAAEHGALNSIVSNADAVPGQNQNTYRSQRPIPRLIMRTLFFDDLVTLALQQQQQPRHDSQQLADRLFCISTCTNDAASSASMLQAHTRSSACSSTVHGPDAQLHYLHQLLMPQPKELQPVCKSISTVNMNRWMLDAPCTQVVLLGAGYDSRPWRLALPPPALHTVKWFEVDHASVIMRKQILLQQAGAQINIPTTLQQRHSISSHAQDRPIYLSDCSMEERDANVKHPLRVHAWTAVAADLEKPGWSSALVAAGFSPFERTVWVLEGLLYYFEPTSVPRCLQEAARMSAKGSILAASIIVKSAASATTTATNTTTTSTPTTANAATTATATPAVKVQSGATVRLVAAGRGADSAAQSTTGSALTSSTAAAEKAGPGNASSSSGGSSGAALGTRSHTSVGGSMKGGGGDGGAQAQGNRSGSSLARAFQWYCPGDVHGFFRSAAWPVVHAAPWMQWAALRGLPVEPGAAAGSVHFVLART